MEGKGWLKAVCFMIYKISFFLLFLPNLRYWTLLPSDHMWDNLPITHTFSLSKFSKKTKRQEQIPWSLGMAKRSEVLFYMSLGFAQDLLPAISRLRYWHGLEARVLSCWRLSQAALGRKVCKQHWWLPSLRWAWKWRVLHHGRDKGLWVATKSHGSITSLLCPFFSFIQ